MTKKRFIIGVLILTIIISGVLMQSKKDSILDYKSFLEKVENNEIGKVTIIDSSNKIEVITKDGGKYLAPNLNDPTLVKDLSLKGVEVVEELGVIGTIVFIFTISLNIFQLLFYVSMFALIFFVLSFLAKIVEEAEELGEKGINPGSINISSIGGSGPEIMQQRDNSKKDSFQPIKSDIRFDDLKGVDELKKDIKGIVDFLKNPEKYAQMGARVHKGVALYGPPGTGKTLTAKAIAGEADLPFYSINGSEFMEMYVGVGAKRVRELYEVARKNAPCIVFIDEIDAIGGKRDGSSNSDEKNRTINQLLAELDGFNNTPESTVLTIIATNRLDMLDPALIRPGRFDKQLAVNLPDKKGRIEILKLHAKNKKLSKDISLEGLAEETVGFSGAGLESLLNEAAFIAALHNKKEITQEEISLALFKVITKGDVKSGQEDRRQKDLELVAWHEAGHALATRLLTNDKVRKVTILASTSGAGGITFLTPEDLPFHSKEYIENQIAVSYAGRIGEFLLLGDENQITTGASNDIEQATKMIKGYIQYYGMNEKIGMLNMDILLDNKNGNFNEILIRESQKLSNKIYKETLILLTENKDLLKEMAEQLLKKETLTNEDIDNILFKDKEKAEQLTML